ncbi:hypothetical protein T10_13682 [Trichinella papuae]|uniref:Uncharacterized protein n=1 Tax=Trichinella papuae TaxID=268474 RepID=A0A0V1NA54_9BILA|nr:hypothetical protein T10_13682 [Trichinella papuae]
MDLNKKLLQYHYIIFKYILFNASSVKVSYCHLQLKMDEKKTVPAIMKYFHGKKEMCISK